MTLGVIARCAFGLEIDNLGEKAILSLKTPYLFLATRTYRKRPVFYSHMCFLDGVLLRSSRDRLGSFSQTSSITPSASVLKHKKNTTTFWRFAPNPFPDSPKKKTGPKSRPGRARK